MDYEKAYKDALSRAKESLETAKTFDYEDEKIARDIRETVYSIFTELKDSDDEIKRELISLFQDCIDCKNHPYNASDSRRWIAWLEKQGEPSIYDVPSRNIILAVWELGNDWKELTNGCISIEHGTQLEYIQKHWKESEYYLREKQGERKQKQGEQKQKQYDIDVLEKHITKDYISELAHTVIVRNGWKIVDAKEQKPANKPKFKVGDRVNKNDREDEEYNIITITSVNVDEHCYICNQCSVIDFEEQDLWHIVEQKPAWSEDDEQYCRYIIDFYLQKSYGATAMAIEWLENLKNRVQPQPKQEWSISDERILNNIFTYLGYAKDGNKYCTPELICEAENWLKSLKPQSRWKPTDEQMEAFGNAIEFLKDSDYSVHELIILFNDLQFMRV